MSTQETQTCVFVLLCLSADDEDSRSLLSHRRKTLYHHVVHQSVFILFFVPPSSVTTVSFCSSSGWNLLLVPHWLRQLTGQLFHCHLQDIEASFILISHLRVLLCSLTTCAQYRFLLFLYVNFVNHTLQKCRSVWRPIHMWCWGCHYTNQLL